MNTKESYWTIRVVDGWAVKRQGSRELLAVFELQHEAWAEARRLGGGKGSQAGFTGRTSSQRRTAA